MRNKGVALLVAALMVWTLAMPALAADVDPPVNPFYDVEESHWAYEMVVYLASLGIVEGYPDGSFGGNRLFTRYEMAMVVARMLARLENLIDQRVADAVDARTSDLAALIRQTRQELGERIESNHAELSGRIDTLVERLDALEAELGGIDRGPLPDFVPEARAVLLERAIEDLRNRLQELATKDDLSELAERIAAALARLDAQDVRIDELEARVDELGEALSALRDGMLTAEDARAIAELAIADALAQRDREITAALAAAQGDSEALFELLQSRVAELADYIDRLMNEFRPELELLGVRVAELEERLKRQEEAHAALAGQVAENTQRIDELSGQVAKNTDDIDALWKLTDNVRLSGKSETTFEQTIVDGPNKVLRDPRDKDSDEWEDGVEFQSKLTLTAHATPAENVDIKAELILEDVFGGPDGLKPGVNLEVTTPGVLRMLRAGDLDEKHIAEAFDKYTFDAERAKERFDDEWDVPFQGADVHLVFGQDDSTEVDAFISRKGQNSDVVWGAASSYQISPAFNLTLRGVRDYERGVGTTSIGPQAVTLHSVLTLGVNLAGALSSVGADYSATYVHNNDDDPGSALDLWAEFPLRIANVRVQHASVDEAFDPTFAKELDSAPSNEYEWTDENDWLDRRVDPPSDWVQQRESDTAVIIKRPVLGVDFALTMGRRTDADPAAVNDNNRYTQLEVGPFHFAGLDVGLLYDRRTNDADALDNTVRADVDTSILGAAIGVTVHNRVNDQVATVTPDEVEQRSTYITASRDFNFVVPFTVDARYAANQVLDMRSTKLGVSAEREFGAVLLRAGFSTEQNAIGGVLDDDEDVAKQWWKNAAWSDQKRDVATIGAEYTLREFFGTDVNTSYEYKLVRVNDSTHGVARNTFTVGFEKELRGGEATLSGEGKYVTGGVPEEFTDAGNDADLTAKLTLTYPVFERGKLKLGGEYVSSTGDKRPEYTAYNLNAGLTLEF